VLVLVSAIAPPQTVTQVRLSIGGASSATKLSWCAETCSARRMASPGCGLGPTEPSERRPTAILHTSRTILWPAQIDGEGPFASQAVRSREVCRGDRVSVMWDEDALDDRAAEFAQTVVELLEHAVLPGVELAVGPCADVDGDARLTIAVSPRIRQLGAQRSDLFAFVRAADFRPDGEPAWSNRADMIYLAPHVEPHLLPAILSHELTHVAQFSGLLREFGDAPWPLSEWLLEGHAHAVEVGLTGSTHNLQSRWDAFLSRPEASPLVMVDASAVGRWRDPASRGATAAFCVWLSEHYGPNWWSRLNDLLIGGDDAWRREFGLPFAELYRRWTIHIACHGDSQRRQPRQVVWPADGALVVNLVGTATAYCTLPMHAAETRQITASSDPASTLQVTVVRRPVQPRQSDPTAVAQSAGRALRRSRSSAAPTASAAETPDRCGSRGSCK
jgi:hypothetical protein